MKTRYGVQPIPTSPLDEAWLAALDLHDDIEELAETAYNPFVIPVVLFTDMEPDPAIKKLASRKLDFVHLGGAGEDVGELSVNCGWGFSAVGFQPRQWNISVGQPQHEVRRFRYVSNFCTKSRQGRAPDLAHR